jgi:methylated-DNA-[protein]-cysteine S-methyltransferase
MKKAVTDFQLRVYEAARRIPRGRVTTYKLLAQALGCGSARAIGQALRANPFAPETPCHRIVASDLSIGGFQGATRGKAIAAKRALLKREGVAFAGGKLRDAGRLYDFGMKLVPRSMGRIPKNAARD